ncbi:ABC transporter ATP-binding protein [Methylovulum psychrotolerans]|uniref:ABC transporter ATP-binding protein n=1 Tax=Methylovulum psychrotolerans TaxID=1704499 RepID=A0A2S5CLM4_9GAMM|nr:ABC transporter ATP-binding protein [Methylovulum psychrotolerans]POZ51694.1 ABC transporter ATP-binding protein [Methylovulum psychrotolerans]
MGSITVSNLSKAYKQYPSRWSRLAEWLSPFNKPRHQLKWVLRDINFTIHPGEAVGIIGINGAGKSTLLKMITGTTQPTTGSVTMTGRVAAMLELGMGFHPEFTGRQNVFMAGQLLGYSVADIHRFMPDIEAFAEIGDYLDQPVRVYSSGMQMRLAFSVATAQRPDILIIDEALSVGDAYFQHKSFARIREFGLQGTTLLIVSHDKAAIQSICNRAILINAGSVIKEGTPEAIMDYYNAMLAERDHEMVRLNITDDGKVQTVSGSGEAMVSDIALLNSSGAKVEVVDVGQAVCLQITVAVHKELPELVLGYMIKDRLGQPVFGINTHHLCQTLSNVSAGESICFKFAFAANLGEGSYSIAVALHTSDTHIGKNYEWRDLALVFNVINMSRKRFVGVAWLSPELEVFR